MVVKAKIRALPGAETKPFVLEHVPLPDGVTTAIRTAETDRRWAVVIDGVVDNVVLWDGNILDENRITPGQPHPWLPPDNVTLIELHENSGPVGRDWSWTPSGGFKAPPPSPPAPVVATIADPEAFQAFLAQAATVTTTAAKINNLSKALGLLDVQGQ